MKPVLLLTDWAIFGLVIATFFYAWRVRRVPHLAATWRRAFKRPVGAVTALILACFVLIATLDSMHFRERLSATPGAVASYSASTRSVLDVVLARQESGRETTYSRPLSYLGYLKETVEVNGEPQREFPRLAFGGKNLKDPEQDWRGDVLLRSAIGLAAGLAFTFFVAGVTSLIYARRAAITFNNAARLILQARTVFPLRALLLAIGVIALLIGVIASLSSAYHVFGTDRVGSDLLYLAMKSVRTALVIGTLTTLVTLPIAVVLGMAAGYLRGWADEAIQYVVTVINSIPYVLLIAACVLSLMIYIDNNPQLFETTAERTDARLFFLCVILGFSSWTDLARLIRGEVMKLSELEYVQAAQAFGVGTWRIMIVHLLPNIMHIILINVVISFSGLVLAEAVLSYVGVGVDPSMASFGTLINTSRLELAREPVIWWTLATAFIFMFALVLTANLFSDAVRDAFDPRSARR